MTATADWSVLLFKKQNSEFRTQSFCCIIAGGERIEYAKEIKYVKTIQFIFI